MKEELTHREVAQRGGLTSKSKGADYKALSKLGVAARKLTIYKCPKCGQEYTNKRLMTRCKHIGDAAKLIKLSTESREVLKDANLPSDLSTNHDYYAWGGEKKKD